MDDEHTLVSLCFIASFRFLGIGKSKETSSSHMQTVVAILKTTHGR